jgi:CBS domain-containing protein
MVPEEDPDDDSDKDGDSDDETPGLQGAQPNYEMTITALNLLLSVLEANPTLSLQSAPALEEILGQAERLAKAPSESVRALAREARMLLTVHLASASTASPGPAREPEEDRIRSTYQRALKLLQDALLPVRAHGLLLLRELVTVRAGTTPHEAVRALEPAIRDVFLQAVQDDDSYIFLNAVQGLAALANSFGADVLRALVRVYADGLQGVGAGALTQQDIDVRLRIGEALGQVIRRCGDVLPHHSDYLIPPLFALVRGSYLPTTLRTSSLSLLATIADIADLALFPYANDIAHAMLDLLQIEGARALAQGQQHAADANPNSIPQSPTANMDSQPTAANPIFPPFRRASLHFLGILVRAYTRRAYASADPSVSESSSPLVDDFPIRRAATTLGYIAATDADAVVRVMAGEVGDAVHTLERTLVGL